VTVTQRRPLGGSERATHVSLAATDESSIRRPPIVVRVRVVLDTLMQDGNLTSEGRSRLCELEYLPVGAELIIDASQQRYATGEACRLIANAVKHGVLLTIEAAAAEVGLNWRRMVEYQGGWRRDY
jgi:hypothetical protein